MDFPDRLPYEVLDRVHHDTGPALRRFHEIRPGVLVISSKKSGTFRPFVRLHPQDLILYQALVDALAPGIEAALPPSEYVGAYRQTTTDDSNAFAGTPSNDSFKAGLSKAISESREPFVLQTDVSGYFLSIRPDRLKTQLLELSERADVIEDLSDVLECWQTLGIRGLPQGARPSSPLGNVYLGSLDRLMGAKSVPFYRWMDDMWAICPSFREARRIQDVVEQHLYSMGLTLNGEKTQIIRASTAIKRLEPARKRFEDKAREARDEGTVIATVDDYSEEEQVPDPDEVDYEITLAELERLTAQLDADDLPSNFHADMGHVLRKLEAIESPEGIPHVTGIIRRAPDLADTAMRYVASVSEHEQAAVEVFAEVLHREHYSRDFEKLTTCNRALALDSSHSALADTLADIALTDQNPLIRAKALVAWGKHSDVADVSTAEMFLMSAEPSWRVYAFVAVQSKQGTARDQLYKSWGGSAPGLSDIAAMLRTSPIKWTRL